MQNSLLIESTSQQEDTGIQGDKGKQGDTGLQGDTGIQRDTGIQGYRDTGDTCTQGYKKKQKNTEE